MLSCVVALLAIPRLSGQVGKSCQHRQQRWLHSATAEANTFPKARLKLLQMIFALCMSLVMLSSCRPPVAIKRVANGQCSANAMLRSCAVNSALTLFRLGVCLGGLTSFSVMPVLSISIGDRA